MADYHVNTDIVHEHPENYKVALSENKVFAHGKCKHCLDKIKPEDRVFVYHNKVGFIGFGIAINSAQNGAHKPGEEDFRFVEIKFTCKENPNSVPLQGVNINYRVRGTCWRIRKTGIADTLAALLKQMFPSVTSLNQSQSPPISNTLATMQVDTASKPPIISVLP